MEVPRETVQEETRVMYYDDDDEGVERYSADEDEAVQVGGAGGAVHGGSATHCLIWQPFCSLLICSLLTRMFGRRRRAGNGWNTITK